MTTPNFNPLVSNVQNLIKEQVQKQTKNAAKAVVVNMVIRKLHPEAQRTVRIVSDFVKSR